MYNEESNGNEHLTLAYTDESKDTLKSMKNYVISQAIMIKNIWKSNLIRMMIYHLKKQFHINIIVSRYVSQEDSKHYPQVFREIFKLDWPLFIGLWAIYKR